MEKTKDELLKEIARVEIAITYTNSKYLRRDYEKYLRKLRVRLRRCKG